MSGQENCLEGQVAVVTGGGRGIGAAVAKALAERGASVVVNDLGVAMDGTGKDSGPVHDVVTAIKDAGGKAIANTSDITDYDGCEILIQSAVNEFGKLDILVNAAGILRDKMIWNMEEADWDAVVAVHLKGTYNTTRHAARYWHDTKGVENRRLINFTSGSGLFGAPAQPNYSAAKMGIYGLTLSCANSLGRDGVTSNAVAPVAGTRMTIPVRPDVYEAEEMAPEHIAPAVVYLASKESAWMNGRVIWASGKSYGLIANPSIERETEGRWTTERMFTDFEREFRRDI